MHKKYMTLQKWLQNFMQPLIFNCTKTKNSYNFRYGIFLLEPNPPVAAVWSVWIGFPHRGLPVHNASRD